MRDVCQQSVYCYFFFSSRRRHTRFDCDWSSDVCSSDLHPAQRDRFSAEVEPRVQTRDSGETMSAVIDSGHAHDEHAHGPYGGVMRWVTTTNHKEIGTLYLWFSFTMFLVGGMLALALPAGLFQPGL